MMLLNPSEFSEQCVFIQWLRLKRTPFYAIPNGFKATASEGAKMKRQGLQPGVPDICIPVRRGDYGALYIEMKRKAGGYVSAAQQSWIDYLNGAGYRAEIALGAESAIRIVEKYMKEN